MGEVARHVRLRTELAEQRGGRGVALFFVIINPQQMMRHFPDGQPPVSSGIPTGGKSFGTDEADAAAFDFEDAGGGEAVDGGDASCQRGIRRKQTPTAKERFRHKIVQQFTCSYRQAAIQWW